MGPNGTTDSWLTFDDTQLSSVVEVEKNLGGMYGYDGNIGKPLIGLNENEMEAEPDVIYKDSVGNYYTYTTSPYDESGYYSWYKSTNGTFWTKET